VGRIPHAKDLLGLIGKIFLRTSARCLARLLKKRCRIFPAGYLGWCPTSFKKSPQDWAD
jgi:hypothetical protein